MYNSECVRIINKNILGKGHKKTLTFSPPTRKFRFIMIFGMSRTLKFGDWPPEDTIYRFLIRGSYLSVLFGKNGHNYPPQPLISWTLIINFNNNIVDLQVVAFMPVLSCLGRLGRYSLIHRSQNLLLRF